MAAENTFEITYPLSNYQYICIDTDLEPDDKAALYFLFRVLHEYQQKNYPKITIIAGSSTHVALKVLQAQKIISTLKKEGFIPSDINIDIIAGTPTNKEHPNDGKELLSEKELSSLDTIEPTDTASKFLSDFLLNNPTKEKRAYFGLRSMQDLIQACKGLTDETFHHVDFIGTLSFNVRSACTTADDYKEFVRILERFGQALCYEGFHSAKGNTSTATAWKNFRSYLLSHQGADLRKAGAY